jgi:glycerophosphoryl diester phosphodiesterase
MPLSPWRRTGGFLVGGHRGDSAHQPENTLAAVTAAVAAGADFVETDLRLSRDGVPVALHDADLSRLVGDPRPIADLDLAEARRSHPGLMTVAEAIAAAGRGGGVLLDTKITAPDAARHAATVLAPALAEGRVAFGPRNLAAAAAIRAVTPTCPLLGLFTDAADYAALAELGGADTWARLWQPDATAAAIARLHGLGLRVLVMAGTPGPATTGVIAPAAIDRLIGDGADGLMLNDPALAVARRAAAAAARARPVADPTAI